MEDSTPELDRTHLRILEALQADGRLSNVELAEKVGMSESPCFRRVKQLEGSGVISGYTAKLDQRKLGLPVTTFVLVSMDKQDEKRREEFVRRVQAEPHIIECHAMTGAYDFLLKIVARNIDHFSELSMRGILRWPGVRDMESQFSLEVVKAGGALPIGTVGR
ncbi:MAG TPA: Lrp/AsnC family transcriptional regulator [Nevskiaceae bacterium]|nr:Lrp/AsnC family transcriptional regulator [Nevskiaceae bacterium]